MPMPLISTLSRRKSLGRLARSVEMITHRPVMGSFLNSGKRSSSFRGLRLSSYHRNVAKKRYFKHSLPAVSRETTEELAFLLRRKSSLVQADYGTLAGAGFDRQNIESERGGARLVVAEELPRHPGEISLLF